MRSMNDAHLVTGFKLLLSTVRCVVQPITAPVPMACPAMN